MNLIRILTLLILIATGYIWYAYPSAEVRLKRLAARNLACGETGQPCLIEVGSYNVLLPRGKGPFPAVLFFHGSGLNGASVIGSQKIAEPLLKRGYALIAPTALDVTYVGDRRATGWNWDGQRNDRDDYHFVQNLLDDAIARFSLDEDKLIVAGYSNGATFVWYLACQGVDDRLRHFAPIGGTPSRGHPLSCADIPPNFHLFHTHGQNDRVVPLQGTRPTTRRGWMGALEAIRFLKAAADCSQVTRGDAHDVAHSIMWRQCRSGTEFRLDVTDDGHAVPLSWADDAVSWHQQQR